MRNPETTLFLAAILAIGASAADHVACRRVEAALKPGAPWTAYPTRTLDDLPIAVRQQSDASLSSYGGLASGKTKATGFFHVAKVNDRWWLVDPEGCCFLSKGVSSVKMVPTSGAVAALKEKFGSEAGWAKRTTALLREHGFNSLGAWSDTERLRAVARPLPYVQIWNFMSVYGKKRGGTFQQPGHTGYPNDCIFVFDPEFELFCDEHARQLATGRDDPWLLGHFSDNELPFKRQALANCLALPTRDSGHQAALDWLRQRHGSNATAKDITPEDQAAFQGVVVERYYRVVSRAIKRHDPNHLYLGSRFYGADLRYPEIFRAAGPHVDVVSVNYYRAWTPVRERLEMWARESGKPVLITEWYAKSADSGLANTSGAGWLVKTQRDRGWFYENFTLALLESPVCVGWHWFKYVDNDPDDTTVDPSNRDANKGIVSHRYEPYQPLLDSIKRINERSYSLREKLSAASVCLEAMRKGREFLVNLMDPDLDLLPEFLGSDVYWLSHDNYLAAKVLAPSHPALARRIQAAMEREGITQSGKVELLFGEAQNPLPFRHHQLPDVRRSGSKQIRTEVVTDQVLAGWKQYADLLLFAAIAEKGQPAAAEHWKAALRLWDGKGFLDPATRQSGRYATYKLALALIAANRLSATADLPRGLLEQLLALQADSGGWITDYNASGERIGQANVETTCLAILGLEAVNRRAMPAVAPVAAPASRLPAFRYHGVVLEASQLKYRPHDDVIYPSVVRVDGRTDHERSGKTATHGARACSGACWHPGTDR